MTGAYATLLLIIGASAVIGQALLALASGVRRASPQPLDWLAPAVGLAAMLVLAGAAARLPGHGTTALVVLALALVAALGFLRGRVSGIGSSLATALPVVVVATLAVSIPFIVAGQVGILGAGLVNDDMASHLLIADHVRDPDGFVPTFVRGGYPTGPHAVVVALSEGLGTGLIEAFAGFTLALAPITGLVALALLADLRPRRRIVGASLVSLTYLGASFLASGAFKEPLQALILIAFAVLLAALAGMPTAGGAGGPRGAGAGIHPVLRVLPLAVLAAASVFNYSLPGLLWVGAVAAAVLAARWWLVKPAPQLPADWRRRALPYLFGAAAVVALATAQEWSRIADFARLEALNPDRFGSDLGNLKGAINPLEALGIWPTGDYRTSAAAAGPPALLFWFGGGVAAAALVAGLAEARRRGLWALPAALAAIAAVWGITAIFSTPYIAAKALAIAAPVAMLIIVRGLLGWRGLQLSALAVVFVAAAGLSSFLALRQAPVRPDGHSADLAAVRAAVQEEEVLFLGRDNFIAWELRGSDEITGIVTNFYSVEDVRGRFKKGEGGGEKFDVDAVFPKTLDAFRFILSPTGGPRSSPPPRFEPIVETRNYVLWERTGLTGRRKTLQEGIEPGAFLGCRTPIGRRVGKGKGTAQIWTSPPIVWPARSWEPDAEPTDKAPSRMRLKLPPGRWLISLAYDSRRPLRVSAPRVGLDAEVRASLDFRGPSPTFPVAEVRMPPPPAGRNATRPFDLTVEVAAPNALARLIRAPNTAHLRQLTATPLGVIERSQRRRACGQYVDWYRAR